MDTREERCDRSDLPKSGCSHCRSAVHKVERRMTAMYRTECRGCGSERGIQEGDRIGRVNGNWVCPDCTREAS